MPQDIGEVFYQKALANRAFIVSEPLSITAGNSKNVHLKNPSDSGRSIVFVDISVSGDGTFLASLHDEFSSAPSGGTTVEIQAALLDSDGFDDNGIADANKNVSFTDGGATYASIGGGNAADSVGGALGMPKMVMEPGREVVVKLENPTQSDHEYAISMTYFEKST